MDWLKDCLVDESKMLVPENYEVPILRDSTILPTKISRKHPKNLFSGYAVLLAPPFYSFSCKQFAVSKVDVINFTTELAIDFNPIFIQDLLKYNGAIVINEPSEFAVYSVTTRICIVGELCFYEQECSKHLRILNNF